MATSKPHQSVYITKAESDALIQEWLDTTHYYPEIEEEIPALLPEDDDEDD